jgi:hypothetical protein
MFFSASVSGSPAIGMASEAIVSHRWLLSGCRGVTAGPPLLRGITASSVRKSRPPEACSP